MATIPLEKRPHGTNNLQLFVMESDDFIKGILSERESLFICDSTCRILSRFTSILCDICYFLDTYQYSGHFLSWTTLSRTATVGRAS